MEAVPGTTSSTPTPLSPDQKYCSECGKVILRRAVICPSCGCSQAAAQPSRAPLFASLPQASDPVPRQHTGPEMTDILLMLVLNFLWPGLGNAVVGDKRGWRYMVGTVFVCIIGFFTFWIPVILVFVLTSYRGYEFLTARATSSNSQTDGAVQASNTKE